MPTQIAVKDASGATVMVNTPPGQLSGRMPVQVDGFLGVPRQIPATATSEVTSRTTLTATCTAVRLHARGANLRFSVGVGNQTATRGGSHFLPFNATMSIAIAAGSSISVVTDASEAAGTAGVLEVSEFIPVA